MENVYMIAAGGTGGHFYPGYALGKKLIERGHNVVFIIKKGSRSARVLERDEIFYQEVDCIGMPRSKNILHWFTFIKKTIACMFKMRGIMEDYKPVVCIGMGGYISFSAVFIARLMRIKTVVHDSNSKIGLANRLSAKFVDLFLLGLPTEDKIKKAVLVGTPVRPEFRLKESVEEKNYWSFATDFGINILIFGGSQGARLLNFAVAKTVLGLLKKTQRIHFLHITGARDYEEIKEIYKDSPNVEVISYADDIHALMKAAHFIIARSGASSLAEIVCLKKPSILVPYPYAADNHQYHNARVLSDKGCSILIEESCNLPDALTDAVRKIMAAPAAIKTMSSNFDTCRLPDPLEAADYAADAIEKLAKKSKKN